MPGVRRKRRATDSGSLPSRWGRWGRDLTVAVAVGLALWGVIGTQANVSRLEKESHDRIDETCRISETKQKSDVDALAATYRYLGQLKAAEFSQAINRAVLAGLPRTVREAQTDDAPDYCDEPHVGLPEPDPVLPKRPPGIPPASG